MPGGRRAPRGGAISLGPGEHRVLLPARDLALEEVHDRPARAEARVRPQQVQLADALHLTAADIDPVVLQDAHDLVLSPSGDARKPERTHHRHRCPPEPSIAAFRSAALIQTVLPGTAGSSPAQRTLSGVSAAPARGGAR